MHPSEANSRWILIENQDRLRIGDRVQIPFPDELGRAQAVSVARGIIEDREERGDRRWLVGKWNNGDPQLLAIDFDIFTGELDLAFRAGAVDTGLTGQEGARAGGSTRADSSARLSRCVRPREVPRDAIDSDEDVCFSDRTGDAVELPGAEGRGFSSQTATKKRASSPEMPGGVFKRLPLWCKFK